MLLLALALAVYSAGAGALALHRKDDRLGETARRAGIAAGLRSPLPHQPW
jgi:hypothetical protein